MQDINKENREFDKVVELLKPKFPRRCEFSFTKPRTRIFKRIWAVSGIVAMLAIILTVAIKSAITVSAMEVINSALADLSTAESLKVEFVWRGVKSSAEEIYTPNPEGNLVKGTLYLLRKNGKVLTRIDWHDDERNSIIFNGNKYIHLKNGRKINTHSSSFGEELINLVSANTVPEDLKKESSIVKSGDRLSIKSHKDVITFYGEFQRDSKRLINASVATISPNGRETMMAKTKSIEIGIDIPEALFSE